MKNTINVVSLKDAVKRREHIKEMFSNLEANFYFFDAIDKDTLPKMLSKTSLEFKKDSLTQGEQGCFMSHYLLWQKMLDKNMPYMIIIEDDVILSRNINKMLDSLDEIMIQCDVLKFETMNIPILLDDRCTDIITSDPLELKQLKSGHWGTAGYVITNTFAKRLCNLLNNNVITNPIDHILFEDMLDTSCILQTVPAFAIQEDVLNKNNARLKSGLEEARSIRKSQKIKRSLSEKFQRELYRIFKIFFIRYWKDKKEQNMLAQEIQNRAVVIDFEE